MNGQQALAFLKQHQPLPTVISESDREKFRDALVQLRERPLDSEEAVPLLLHCWDGTNADLDNEPIIFTLKSFPKELVAAHVVAGLKLDASNRRTWFGEVACAFPDARYVGGLAAMLGADSVIERFVAACALEQVGGEEARSAAERRLELEPDPEICDVLEAIIAGS